MEICKKEKCTACGVCINVCPTKCIELSKDKLGNLKYNVDLQKCVECGVCKNNCPNNKHTDFFAPYKCFAASNKNTTLFENTASGGISRALYEKFLEEGALVVGACFDDGEFSYIITDNAEEINCFSNSKYVRCKSVDIYPKIKVALRAGRKVLFIGLPCQVAGLKNYLGNTYKNLITVDLICHGAPEQQYFYDYLGYKNVSKNTKFRKNGEYMIVTQLSNHRIKIKPANKSSYLLSFIKGITLSESCYFCQYAKSQRVGDISIGDFWGADDSLKNKFLNKRISCVLINTKIGEEEFFLLNNIQFVQVEFEQIQKNNRPLNNPQVKTYKRRMFEKLYPIFGYKITMFLIGIYWNIAFNRLYELFTNIKNRRKK